MTESRFDELVESHREAYEAGRAGIPITPDPLYGRSMLASWRLGVFHRLQANPPRSVSKPSGKKGVPAQRVQYP